jgi:HK97 family phage portal protein
MTLPYVFAALRHIIDYGSTLPMDCFRRIDEDSRQRISPPLLVRGLDEPGRPGMVSWLGQAFYGLAAAGNAVGWVSESDGLGYPTVVGWMKRSDWSFDEQTAQWYAYGHPVASSRILHIPWIVPDGYTLGLSPLELFIATIKAGLSAQDYSDITRGGGIPPSVLRNTAKTLVAKDADLAKARAKSAFARGEPFVTGNDWDLTVTAIPPNHAQFIETLKLTASQVAAIYGIDRTEIGGEAANSLTYTTEEHRLINRAANMTPYIERVERAVSRVLPTKQFVKLNIDAKIRADIKTRTEVVGEQLADGRLSLNEARALDDMPPVTGGDRHNMPVPTTAPITREGETP